MKNKKDKNLLGKACGIAFKKEVKEFVDELYKLSRYNSNHDKILDNFGDIGMVVKRFRKKHYH